MTTPPDLDARRSALDVTQSFIVQAPAGSGKTELLIQRYLCLLATVEEPEQVVAITFTRKAAAEMRARIRSALKDALDGVSTDALHRQETLRIAARVLDVDAKLGWDLYVQPQRMRIETLDALNASLAMRLPLLSGGIAGARVLEDASSAHRAAAANTIESAVQDSQLRHHVEQVLHELDYNFERCERMIADLLACREQWLSSIVPLDEEHGGASLEDALQGLLNGLASSLVANIEDDVLASIERLAQHASEHATSAEYGKQVAGVTSSEPYVRWRAIATLLLVKTGSWRRRLTKAEGFLPAHREHKDELFAIIDELDARNAVLPRLAELMRLPDPASIASELVVLQSVRAVLLHAVAELRMYFAATRCTDFAELALSAQGALGAEDNPSDLLLALDRRIQHILVDEYQDTSASQIRLLELLTAGWTENDGRTLFLVGDPMQSIYRFRNADMSLFLRTRNFGIGNVKCQPLVLSANFRSSPRVVHWVNETFAEVFPSHDDLERGLAAFHASEAVRAAADEDGVFERAIASTAVEDEVAEIIAIVESERGRAPLESIGILVQSRAHLRGLQARLQQRGWAVRAVEIDALHSEQFVQDLLGLARALSHLADRPAWLGVLRAPWCGLTWSDLEILVHGAPTVSIWELLSDDERLTMLSDDGRARAAHLRSMLATAMQRRGERPFIIWLEETWRALGGPDCLVEPPARIKLAQFFAGLEAALVHQGIEDPVDLERYFERPQRQPDEPNDSVIEIMTIHRAKGLEFDSVIVSGLNRKTRADEYRLLSWLDTNSDNGYSTTLLAAYRQTGSDLGTYIRGIEAQRAEAERARLLYVATTRARRRLHLLWGIEDEKPVPASLLSQLWPRVCDVERTAVKNTLAADSEFVPMLRRIERVPDTAAASFENAVVGDLPVEFEWVSTAAVHVGVVVHSYLQLMAEEGLNAWSAARVNGCAADFERHLELLGVDAADLRNAVTRVRQALLGVLADPQGRWIVGPHDMAQSELTLVDIVDNRLTQLRVDRTFVEEGVRWIVDYKTGSHEGADAESFLDAEVERYRPQMESYARALARNDERPIRVALYFPLLQALRAWQFSDGG